MRVVRVAGPEAIERALFDEFRPALERRPSGLIGLATGRTYAALFRRITTEARDGKLDLRALRATHLDEYLGFGPTQRGGMVHELVTRCPPLAALLAEGRFVAVPSDGSPDTLLRHERRLAALGGVALQFLGVGRNGHIAFNEPGTPADRGFHRVVLAESTRADARSRFAPDAPPFEAVTAGPRSILAARRLVVAAFGDAKAPAVRDMLEGPIGSDCPASYLRRHADCVLYLDADAASLLRDERGIVSG